MVDQPAYFRRPELPDVDMFQCSRLLASLSVAGCADMWRQANVLQNNRYPTCVGCPRGASHAGVAHATLSPIAGVKICARCGEGATRLICGEICVSCKNREYEFVKGRNARGQYPTRMAPLAPRAVRYATSTGVAVKRLKLSTTTEELIIGVLRDARAVVRFGWNGGRTPVHSL